ncbi:PREDICTED: RING finger protein vilya [Drosophila arizonae]|uniref:RING finger protein vilya n=1 Tax=Drosophila arizonae TaxID=7263 RepID=A0ABM1PYE6_DROAR|nr:PREDICTED: RING finger protein vilya [Drosophila arizonae]
MIADHSTKSTVSIDATKAKKIWIHCNSCFEHYVNEKTVIFLLACQHVICEKCVTASLGRIPGDAPTYVCPICQKMVRGRQVNNALPSNLKGMFHPAPWHDGLPHDLIDSFQRANFKNLEKFILKKEKEEQKLDKDLLLARGVCQKQYLEQHRLRRMLRELKFRVRKISQQVKIKKRKLAQSRRAQRSISVSAKKAEKQITKHSLPEVKSMPITSFVHHNNYSFDL